VAEPAPPLGGEAGRSGTEDQWRSFRRPSTPDDAVGGRP
jgi:hypothetical protein